MVKREAREAETRRNATDEFARCRLRNVERPGQVLVNEWPVLQKCSLKEWSDNERRKS